MKSTLDELELEIEQEIEPALQSATPPTLKPVQAAQKPSPWRTRILLTAGALVLAAAGTAGYRFWFDGTVSTDDAQVDGHIVTIAPKVTGHIVEVLVTDNQPVKAGDVMARIDARDFQAKVDQAKAALQEAESAARSAGVTVPLTRDTTTAATANASALYEAAEADFLRAQASLDQASRSDLAYAKANVDTKKANNDRAQADLERMKPLVDKAEISRQQFDSYVAAARAADSELRAAEEQVASAMKQAEIQQASLAGAKARVAQAKASLTQSIASEKQVDVRSADLGNSVAKVEAAKAALEAAQLQLSYTEIKAPINGVVTRKTVELGQMVQPGQGLLVLVPLDQVWVTANFKETQLSGVQPGQKAEIKVDMYGRKIAGTVDSVAGATGSRLSLLPPENATGNYVKVVQRIPVKIVLNARDLQQYPLRVGMNVDASIQTSGQTSGE